MVGRQFVFMVSVVVLLLSMAFFAWVLQQPSAQLASVDSQPYSQGKVVVNVVGTPTPNSSPGSLKQAPASVVSPESGSLF